MQGQMAELKEPTWIIIYLTLISVDAAVMSANLLASSEVVLGRVVLQCMLSKLCFGCSLAIFFDDRVFYVFKCFVMSTLFSLIPTVLTI